MVRLLLFFSVLLLVPFTLRGQVSITVDPLNFTLAGHPSQADIHYDVIITNITNETINLLWSKRMRNQPTNWESYICDKTACWDESFNSCPPDKPNTLAAGDTMSIQVHLNPFQTEGTGTYELNILDENGAVITTVNAVFTIGQSTAVKETNESKLTVFPNPTSEFFKVSDTPGLRYVELFNIVGNKIKSFDAAPQKQYSVGDLPDGIYLVRLMNSSKKVIKTIRLSKR